MKTVKSCRVKKGTIQIKQKNFKRVEILSSLDQSLKAVSKKQQWTPHTLVKAKHRHTLNRGCKCQSPSAHIHRSSSDSLNMNYRAVNEENKTIFITVTWRFPRRPSSITPSSGKGGRLNVIMRKHPKRHFWGKFCKISPFKILKSLFCY